MYLRNPNHAQQIDVQTLLIRFRVQPVVRSVQAKYARVVDDRPQAGRFRHHIGARVVDRFLVGDVQHKRVQLAGQFGGLSFKSVDALHVHIDVWLPVTLIDTAPFV